MLDRNILNQIAKGIEAAERVRTAYDTNMRGSSGVPGSQDRVSLLSGTLSAIAESFPGSGRNHLAEALEKSSRYCGHYRNAKTHFRGWQSGDPGSRDPIQALRVLSPMLGNRSGGMLEKVLLMLELMNSADFKE